MAAYGTYYLGGPKKLYKMSIKIPFPEWMTVKEMEAKICDIIKWAYRKDESYYFDDDDSLKTILDYVDAQDEYVYYGFICDRETCKKLEQTRKYWGFLIEKTGGRWH